MRVNGWKQEPALCLGLDAGGHGSMGLKILWSESSVRVRPPPPAPLFWRVCGELLISPRISNSPHTRTLSSKPSESVIPRSVTFC